MPAGRNWSYVGARGDNQGYKYKDPPLAGPVKKAIIKPGKLLKVSASGAALGHTLAVDPTPVDVIVSTGTMDHVKHCMSFSSALSFTPNSKYLSKDSPAPSMCHP
jgi:hypothetical protein